MAFRPPDSAGPADRAPRGRRLSESLFLPVVLVVMAGSAWYASREPEETGPISLPDFSLPGLELDVAIELPYRFAPLRRREAPRLEIGRDTEGVIAAVRRGLLESSAREKADVEAPPASLAEERVASR